MKHKTLNQRIEEQRQWIISHGGCEHGYVLRYGSKDDPTHFGDGGEPIFAADMGAMFTLCRRARVEVSI
jgi:hypothetical protein